MLIREEVSMRNMTRRAALAVGAGAVTLTVVGWNQGAHADVFPALGDPALQARYRRWRALMAQATGI